jgi:hypothetical protein
MFKEIGVCSWSCFDFVGEPLTSDKFHGDDFLILNNYSSINFTKT